MRFLFEIAIVVALIYYGWEKPFKDWVPGSKPAATAQPVAARKPATVSASAARSPIVARAVPVPAATAAAKSGSWMWGPNHHGTLDRPVNDQSGTFTGHVLYKDDAGRTYWIDGSGQRRYEP